MGKSLLKLKTYFLIVVELFAFLWRQRLWWIIPVVLILLIFAALIFLGTSSGLGPLIYPLF